MNAPTIETSIWLALQSRVNMLPVTYAKAWPGEKFTPPNSNGLPAPYLRIANITSPPDRQLIDSGKPYRRNGRLIITLVYPLGQNISVYNQVAGLIAQHFSDKVKMRFGNVCVSITDYPHCQDGYEDNGYWTVPVSIQWECFA